ncbi:hypothetical protein FHP29_14220 [Nocardioides albidus]|uniref:DUF4034 domain-containing protein n=1 Tax=Nocardioides albidus TaxID=1517589 RepID=A0A5C4VR89_9ACTN|nr:hypothetical protein [Nocardioides albidus]TNM38413.1 hypothetical protein FHP29_14220 [Nocardioides albidus]
MPDIEFDPLVQFPEIGAIRSAVRAGAWEPVASYVDEWRVDDPQRASLAAWTVVETDGAEALLTAQPRTQLTRTLAAALRIQEAWQIRGSGRASTVSDEQWVGFRAKLVAAERELMELAAIDPRDGLVAYLRLTSGRGLGLGLSEAQRRYARLAAICPDYISAQMAHLQTLAPKWSGSTELMFEFARTAVKEGRPGSSAGRLVALAHLEHWLDLGDEGGSYVEREEVQQELVAAADASVFHPAYEPGLRWITDHSYFACLHAIGGRHDLTRRHFEALGPVADLDAWSYFADPRAEHDADRARALTEGARA